MKDPKWLEIEEKIKKACADGILVDNRAIMPRAPNTSWPDRQVKDILGCCLHQSAGRETKDPRATARYHTSVSNHVTPGRPLPSLVYHIAIPDDGGPAWLCGDLSWRTYAQGKVQLPGDENRHLIAVLVLGGFKGLGWNPPWALPGPSAHQMANLAKVVEWLQGVFGFGGEGVFGHYHFGKAACPGEVVSAWVEKQRAEDDKAEFVSIKEWQEALLRWNVGCLPRYGADGDWGVESRKALVAFQREMGLEVTGAQDPFTQLVLLQRYPAPRKPILIEETIDLPAEQPESEKPRRKRRGRTPGKKL